ncbi:hypothetical protein HNY73_018108 [Argiope bruennichi]|uniref:Uncharacterized protein n=1 Tax=Argiope bruennichi TaxID=94029 RepID=A0A8T0ED77_ARGBR|nr:hypothetical protein HNY73_018108 [Argiope bruennichi]
MESKQAMSSAVATLLVLAMFNILPIGGQFVCPWCDKSMQNRLLDCVYAELVSRPQMITLPLQEIDNIKWTISSASDSMIGIPYAEKKVQMDEIFMKTIADAFKRHNQQNNQVMISVVADLAGRCYSSVTGYNHNVVTQDMKRMIIENVKQNPTPLGEDSKPVPNSGMPYPANQNNFQPSQPQIQPPIIPANPAAQRDTSYQPPAANNSPFQNQPPVNGNGYNSNPSLQSNWPLKKSGPVNPPVSQPVNTFNNPSFVNDSPFKPTAAPPLNSFNNPSAVNNAPVPPPTNPSNNPPFVNNGAGPSGNWPPKDQNLSNNPPFVNNGAGPSGNWPPKDQRQAGLDSSINQAPADSSPANDRESQSNRDSPDNAPLTSTSSPKTSSPSQDSKSSNADSLDNSNVTTLSPNPDVSNKKTTETEKSGEEEPCDEKFKIALNDKLINDERFTSFFGKLPTSTTKPALPRIMSRVFKEYGIEQHYSEFSTFWKFESKTLNKESKAEDWDEIISKICKIIFSRNNLLDKDCEETGRKIADYILDKLPGDPPASSAENQNQNGGKDKTSTESNTDSSVQNANPALTSTTIAPLENNSDNTTNPEDLTFPELRSRLGNIFDRDGSPKEKSDDVPLYEMLTAFETQHYLQTLHDAAESCKTPSGFNFKKFLGTMTNVTDLIQKNHPDWSHDKCEKEMYSATVAVLTKELQDALKSNNDNAKSKSSTNQSDSVEDSSDSNSGAKPPASSDRNISSDDSTDPSADSDDTGNAPQPQQEFRNQGSYPNGQGSVNTPPSGNQPGSGNWNAGLTQPSNSTPGPVNSNFANRNPPLPAKQPYEPNYGSQDNGNKFSQPITQNYPAFPPANMNTQPYPGSQAPPSIPNPGFQQSPNFAPNSGVRNSHNGNFGNNRFQEGNRGLNNGPTNPALLNGNSQTFQPQSNWDYNRGVPATEPVVQNRNNQQQFNPNDNSRFPASRPTIPQWQY